MKRALAAVALVAMLAAGCSAAPEPGDLGSFCSLLQTGSGLTPSPTAGDLERLALVAPPEVRPTIKALQNRARDFDELLAEQPPDLEALFNARFDRQANSEKAALDRYALSSCGIEANRPPATRWNSYVRENYLEESWVGLVTAQFVVTADRIDTATMAFAESPEPLTLVEDVCRAASDFLISDGAGGASVQVVIGSVVALTSDSPTGLCQLP